MDCKINFENKKYQVGDKLFVHLKNSLNNDLFNWSFSLIIKNKLSDDTYVGDISSIFSSCPYSLMEAGYQFEIIKGTRRIGFGKIL